MGETDGKEKTTDQRILLMTDSASDISDADLLEGGIVHAADPDRDRRQGLS